MVSVELESWWLDESALPDLLWARLRCFSDGRAEVLDLDGRLTQFTSADEARLFLLEDEYAQLDRIGVEDFIDVGMLGVPRPPHAHTDVELIGLMTVRAHAARSPPVSRTVGDESKRRRDGKHCPVCLAPLRKNAPRTRTVRECKLCGAHPQPEKMCRRCSAVDGAIWEGRSGAACSTCGLHGSKGDVVVELA
jgi:hypothetical protein